MYSIIACRTRHCLSAASSTIAGSNDCDKSSIPITSAQCQRSPRYDKTDKPLLTCSNLLIIFNRTSGNSSLSKWRKRGSKCSIVASFPRRGASPLMWVPRAALTCWEESAERSRTQGKILVRTVSRSFTKPAKPSQKVIRTSQRYIDDNTPGIPAAPAVRTSASLSFKSWTYALTSSSLTRSVPTPPASYKKLSLKPIIIKRSILHRRNY